MLLLSQVWGLFTMFVALFLLVLLVYLGVDPSSHLYDGLVAGWEWLGECDPGALIKVSDTALTVVVCPCEWVKGQPAYSFILFFLLS